MSLASTSRGFLPRSNGRLLRLLGVEVDITEGKLYEDALFREKESAQITLQSIGDGVITTDANSMVEYINPVAEELTGWKVDDASGRSIDEIFRELLSPRIARRRKLVVLRRVELKRIRRVR